MRSSISTLLLIIFLLPALPFATAQDTDNQDTSSSDSGDEELKKAVCKELGVESETCGIALYLVLLLVPIFSLWLSLKIVFGDEATLGKTILFMAVNFAVVFIVYFLLTTLVAAIG